MKLKKITLVLLPLVMVLAIGQTAFAKNYAGGIIGYHHNNLIVLGEWKDNTNLNTERSIAGGFQTNFNGNFTIPVEAALKYDFLRINFANRKLGTLNFGAKGDANVNLVFAGKEANTEGKISAGLGLYGDWDINSNWKVFSDFSIIRLYIMPKVDFKFTFTNLTGVQYTFNSGLALKAEFGYNRFVAEDNFYVGIGVGKSF